MPRKRDFGAEYATYHGKPEQRRRRSMRNKARRTLGLEAGDPREVDHRRPLSRGGGNGRKNLRAVSFKTNRSKGCKAEDMNRTPLLLDEALTTEDMKALKKLDALKKRLNAVAAKAGAAKSKRERMARADKAAASAPAAPKRPRSAISFSPSQSRGKVTPLTRTPLKVNKAKPKRPARRRQLVGV